MVYVVKRDFSPSQPELMDVPGQNPQELQEDLRNLATLNRNFGALAVTEKVFATLSPSGDSKERVLVDLCSGYGDHDRRMLELAQSQNQPLTILALDFQRDTLRFAKQATSSSARIVYIQADALQLPLASGSADAVTCSLALHHFSDSDASRLLKEMARIARPGAGLACVDIVRSRFAAFCIWLITALILTNRITRHDARLSIRRAFTHHELRSLAEGAGWSPFQQWKLSWFRQAVVKPPQA